MSSSTTAERRRLEMAEKRAKLAALRKAREEREAAIASSRASPATTRPSSTLGGDGPAPGGASRNDEIESLLRNVGVSGGLRESVLGRASGGTSVAGSEDVGTTNAGDADAARVDASTPEPEPVASTSASVQASPSPTVDDAPVATAPISTTPVPHPPKPKELYDKSIQTAAYFPPPIQPALADGAADPHSHAGGVGSESAEELRARIIAELEEERKQLDAEIAEEKRRADAELDAERARGMPDMELKSVLESSPFLDFLNQSSKIMQRALADSYDYLRDYTVTADDGTLSSDGAKVRLLGSWWDEKWGRGRSVTDVDWSPKFPELFAASYNKNPMAVNEPDGIVCVWNLHSPSAPEFVFHAQSDVLSVAFSPFHPNIVIGGTYSGQILLWDTRSRNPNPSLRTPLSASGHTHPVYSLSVVGTQNAHNVISASTDGTVCAWTLDMLARPQETLELLHPAHNKADEVSVTTLAFPEGDTTTFWVGTEEGNVYAANRYDRAGAKAGLVQNQIWRGHSGPVTGIDFHPASGAVDLSNLVLTCGVDWTVKLWPSNQEGTSSTAATARSSTAAGAKDSSSSRSTTAGGGSSSGNTINSSGVQVISPIMSFEQADDYVFDVKWHPQHPALFGSVDGSGKFDLWNLNVDTEVPVVSTQVAPTAPRGLNKLAWDKRDGRKAAVGSSDGRVYVYELSPDVATPRENEWELMRKTCNAALQAQREDIAGR